MLAYLVRRLIGGATVMVLVSIFVFGLFFVLPADPARLACGKSCTPELMAEIRHTLELDIHYLRNILDLLKELFQGGPI